MLGLLEVYWRSVEQFKLEYTSIGRADNILYGRKDILQIQGTKLSPEGALIVLQKERHEFFRAATQNKLRVCGIPYRNIV